MLKLVVEGSLWLAGDGDCAIGRGVGRVRRDPAGNMTQRVYCTYFDHNYLTRGLALYRSLQKHAPGARLWVLCLSDACHRALTALDLPDLVPCRLADFEAADP